MKHDINPLTALCLGALLHAGAVSLHAQQPSSPQQVQAGSQIQQPVTSQQIADPQLKLSPLKQLEKFEPSADEEYELGPGDEINLNFPGRPELSAKYTIGPDGRITLPLAGSITLANMTRSAAAKAIIDALAPYYTNLTATVGVDKYGSNRVTVLGNVKNPGPMLFDSTPTLLDVIARGGMMASSNSKNGMPETCTIYRGNDKIVTVDLTSLLQSGNALADMRLRRNDIVFIPFQQESFVSVLGEVMHPGAVPLTRESNLATIIAAAGGIGEGAGGSPNIQIIQKSTGKIRTIHYKELMTPKGMDEVALNSGDVIMVPKSGFYKSTYILQRLSPITSLMSIAALGGVP
jgi:polysaccharide export outer membrane protein